MKYIRTKNGVLDIESAEKRLSDEVKDLIRLKLYDLDDDDDDGEKQIEAELKSIRVTSTIDGNKLTISCESDTQDSFEEYDIVNSSDTLKELFDTCICVDKDEKYRHYSLTNFVDMTHLALEDYDWYGAIWITGEHGEPILTPVAKMNEKEKWELL